MSVEFGSDLITISDESGNDFVLEHVDTVEYGGTFYMAFLPTDMDEDDEDFGLIILKVVSEDEEDILVIIEDEQLLDELFEKFMERLLDDEEE
ncbi:MAG: DUF1292 domain-containing protein [Oscillospiraceae bacterium]|nr:DUF1292 domain-containing protein [Oscillospiraceae bacterium]MCL2278015.1 DUF1292 domain-containing protein [Oscillospiraceae bacterium]